MSKVKEKEKGFIKFYNVFMEKGEYKLTPVQWYFYSLIAARWSPFLNTTQTSVSIISEVQVLYNDKSRPSRNRDKVYQQLVKLNELDVINFNSKSLYINGKIDYDKMIDITLIDYNKFESIYSSVYNRTVVPEENYFMCILQRFRISGYEKSMEDLSKLFNCDTKTAERIIDRMKNKNLIKYDQGEIYQNKNGQHSRKPNKYFIKELVETEESEVEIEVFDDNEEVDNLLPKYITVDIPKGKKTVSEKFLVSDIIVEINKWGSELGYQHYYYAHKFKDVDTESYNKYQKRYVAISKSGKFDFSGYESMLKEEVDRDNKIKEKDLEKRRNAVKLFGSKDKFYVDNMGNVDINNVSEIYYLSDDGLLNSAVVYKIANDKYNNYDEIDEKEYEIVAGEYKRIVKSGRMIQLRDLYKIREMCSVV